MCENVLIDGPGCTAPPENFQPSMLCSRQISRLSVSFRFATTSWTQVRVGVSNKWCGRKSVARARVAGASRSFVFQLESRPRLLHTLWWRSCPSRERRRPPHRHGAGRRSDSVFRRESARTSGGRMAQGFHSAPGRLGQRPRSQYRRFPDCRALAPPEHENLRRGRSRPLPTSGRTSLRVSPELPDSPSAAPHRASRSPAPLAPSRVKGPVTWKRTATGISKDIERWVDENRELAQRRLETQQ